MTACVYVDDMKVCGPPEQTAPFWAAIGDKKEEDAPKQQQGQDTDSTWAADFTWVCIADLVF